MAVNVTRITDWRDPRLNVWPALAAACPLASVFTTRTWAEAWHRVIAPKAELAVLLITTSDGRAAGLLPGCVQRVQGARWLTFLGREVVCGDHLDLLCAEADRPACVAALANYVLRAADLDGLRLGELHRNGPTHAFLRKWAQTHGLTCVEREPQIVPFAVLPKTYDEFVAGLSRNMRYHVRRRTRQALASGARLRTVHGADEVAVAVGELVRLHQRRWVRSGHGGGFRDPRKVAMLRAVCNELATVGAARATMLEAPNGRAGWRVEAILLTLHWNKTASFYQMGWDPDGTTVSAGVVVMAESIADAIRCGCTRYDFLRGAEAYKWKWTSQFVEQTTLAIGWRLPARMALMVTHCNDRLKAIARAALGPRSWNTLRRWVQARPAAVRTGP